MQGQPRYREMAGSTSWGCTYPHPRVTRTTGGRWARYPLAVESKPANGQFRFRRWRKRTRHYWCAEGWWKREELMVRCLRGLCVSCRLATMSRAEPYEAVKHDGASSWSQQGNLGLI